MLTAPLAPAADEMAKVNEHMEVMTKAQPDGLWQVMHNILATKSQKGGFHGELFAMRAPPPSTPFCCVWSVQEEALDPRGKRLDTRQLAQRRPEADTAVCSADDTDGDGVVSHAEFHAHAGDL